MAAFHAEWSSKICQVMVPYLSPQKDENDYLSEISAWSREWAYSRNDINYDIMNCRKIYTRFTTNVMSEILPDLKGIPSAWNTDNHYFYEIYIMASGKVKVQLAINSKGITDEFRAVCDKIQQYYPGGKDIDWDYRIPFVTEPLEVRGISKETLFQYLDNCMGEIHIFERKLKRTISASQ